MTGLLLVVDRPGLKTDYFAITPHWDNQPVHTRVGLPQLQSVQEVSGILVSSETFSVRWRGWIHVPSDGTYRFDVASDEASFLRIDGDELLEAVAARRKKPRTVERFLNQGVHGLELGVSQTGRDSRLAVEWTPPEGERQWLPAELLYARRPVRVFRWLRLLVVPLTGLQRQLLGSSLILAALLVWGRWVRRMSRMSGTSGRSERVSSPGGVSLRAKRAALLTVLFVVSWLATVPFTTDTLDGDDVRYLDAAYHGKKMAWIVNRYVHIHLLRAFFWLEDGDPFAGARSLWSFLFATTVTALAAAVLTLGPGLQLRTLGVVLFLLLSQFSFIGSIGAAYPDYTVMMFVTVAVAVYLHGLSRSGGSRWHWHAMALGALTLLAFRSKETGFIIAWLAVSFLWFDGRLQLKRFAARSLAWAVGAVLALGLLMSLDAALMGDFWFGLRPSSYGSLQGMMSSAGTRTHQPVSLWLNVLIHGHPRGAGIGFAMRNLWALVAVTAAVAFVRRQRIELRILYLMPAVYLLMLFILRPPIFATRHIWPILPMACLAGGMLAFECGLERRRWSRFLAPRVLVPTFFVVLLVLLVLVPVKAGDTDVMRGPLMSVTVLVVGALLVIATIVSILRRSAASPLLLTLSLLLFFAPGLYLTYRSLDRHHALQRGNLTLYPWRAFESEIRAARPKLIQVSPRLQHQYQMVGRRKTRERLARIFFGRPRLRLIARESLVTSAPLAVGSKRDLRLWLEQAPQIAGMETPDPSGQLALVRPR